MMQSARGVSIILWMASVNIVIVLKVQYLIKLYTTNCPKCRALEMKLDKAGIEYEVCDDLVEMTKRNFASAPMLETDDGLFDFSEAIRWVNSR